MRRRIGRHLERRFGLGVVRRYGDGGRLLDLGLPAEIWLAPIDLDGGDPIRISEAEEAVHSSEAVSSPSKRSVEQLRYR